MKFIITLITSLILLIPASGQGYWEIVNVEIILVPTWLGGQQQVDGLADVQFIDRDIGFICAGGVPSSILDVGMGGLYKTEDGGKTWNIINNDVLPGEALSSVLFINESIGFLNGVYKSSDGGYSWTWCGVDVSVEFFLNDSTGWACGQRHIGLSDINILYKTIDGGENWSVEFEDDRRFRYYTSLYFIDEESGWAVGTGGLITKYSLNNGWEKKFSGLTTLPLNKVFFVDRDNGWIAGGYISYNNFYPIFMRTVDGGENWDKITKPNYLINDFHFENKDHGWAVGEYGVGSTKEIRGVILETFNGGLDWDVVQVPTRLNALDFIDGYGWAVGDKGLILKYTPTATGIKDDHEINSGNEPSFQNYPNPFQSSTIISYQLPATSYVELNVYDISGQKVATLVNERQLADRHEVEWNAEGMESGIYFCELKTGQGKRVTKMSIVR